MAFIPGPTGAVKVVIDQSLRGQQVLNVLHFLFDDDPTGTELTTLGELVEAQWASDSASIYDWCNVDLVCNQVIVTKMEAEGGEQVIVPSGVPGQGASSSDSINNMLAVVVSLKTAFTGRSFRGRTFIAGIDEAAIDGGDNNRISTTAQAAINTLFGNLVGNLIIDTMTAQLCVASYFSGHTIVGGVKVPTPRAEALYTPVTQSIVKAVLGTQRRRKVVA